MSKLIPIACLALLSSTAGSAVAAGGEQTAPSAAVLAAPAAETGTPPAASANALAAPTDAAASAAQQPPAKLTVAAMVEAAQAASAAPTAAAPVQAAETGSAPAQPPAKPADPAASGAQAASAAPTAAAPAQAAETGNAAAQPPSKPADPAATDAQAAKPADAAAAPAKPADDAAKPADATKPATPAKRAFNRQRPANAAASPIKGAETGPDGLPAVTISGSRESDMQQRRNSVASRMIFGREELDRQGDSSLGEVLKRLPGVTIGGRPGRGGEIRMRGLGNGYTQILVNGERPPPGFSLDSLSPDQVERIEIMRAPVAEHSTRAIAGTINIVLREGYQQKDVQLKLTDSEEQGRNAPNVSITVPGKVGNLTYLINGSVFTNHQHDDTYTHNQNTEPDGSVELDQEVHDTTDRHSRGVHLSPRLSYKFDNGDTLNYQPFLMMSHSNSTNDSLLVQDVGAIPPEYASSAGTSTASSTFLRGFGNWVHKAEGGAKFDTKFGFGSGHSDSNALRGEYNAAGVLTDQFVDTDSTHDRNATVGTKYTAAMVDGQQFMAGADMEVSHREQTRVSLDNGLAQFADSGDNLTAETRRAAAFAQDEWDVNAQWSVYGGLRWEGIRTSSTVGGQDLVNTSSVWSPLFHAVYRIPDHQKDQLRMALTHSYRAPALNDLIAAPAFSHLNSATKPDRIGNPGLKPEQAKGLDLAYEHYVGTTGIVSASSFVRDIDDLMRRTTTLQNTATGPRWVSMPINIGHAVTSGIELEAKFQLIEVNPELPNIDFRSNFSRFWSHVDDIPGPNNRLEQQAKATANLGADYHYRGLPLTLGGNLNWTPAVLVQSAVTELDSTGRKRQIDIYGLWKFNPALQLRVSANNLAALDYNTGRIVSTDGLAQSAEVLAHTYTTWSAKLEMKF